jgi:coiled-coil domain-containing protein 63/114
MSMDEEEVLKEQAKLGERDLARARAAMEEAMERANAYETALARIRAATGIDSVQDLVASFLKGEESNFSLFNYIAEQSTEIERLEDQIAAMRAEADAATMASGSRVSNARTVLREMEGKLSATRAAVDKFEERCAVTQGTVDAMCRAIGRMFHSAQCDSRGMGDLLAGATVTETNSVSFLSIIEQRSAEVIEAFAAAKALDEGWATTVATASSSSLPEPKSSPTTAQSHLHVSPREKQAAAAAVASVLGPGPTVGKSPSKSGGVHVEAPRLRDMGSNDSDSDEEGETRPLSISELKQSVKRMRGPASAASAGMA